MLKAFCHESLGNNLYKVKDIVSNDFKLIFMEWC